MNKTIASIVIGIIIGMFVSSNIDKVYMNGMLVDNDLLNTLSEKQYNVLSQNKPFETYAIYSKGSEAYIVDNKRPAYVSMHAGLWSDDLTTIHGSSHSMSQRDANNVSPDSGMTFHSIDGELYAYSKGEIRDNPKAFKLLISDLVGQFDDLVVDLKK